MADDELLSRVVTALHERVQQTTDDRAEAYWKAAISVATGEEPADMDALLFVVAEGGRTPANFAQDVRHVAAILRWRDEMNDNENHFLGVYQHGS